MLWMGVWVLPLYCNTCEALVPNFEKLGYGRTWMTLWCHGWGCKSLQAMYHIHIRCIQSVLAPWYAVDGHMGAPLYCYTCGVRGKILKNWGMGEPKWCWGIVVEAARAFRLYTASIECIKCVLAPWYAVDGHMGAPLHWYLCMWGWILENCGEVEPKWRWDVMVEAVKQHWMHPTSILYPYKVFEHLHMLWMGIIWVIGALLHCYMCRWWFYL